VGKLAWYHLPDMGVIVLRPVVDFVDALDEHIRADMLHTIDLLETYGHTLPMPYAKPIGTGLWELRYTGRPQIRILYGFCKGDCILVLAVKKSRSALRVQDIELARERFRRYCS